MSDTLTPDTLTPETEDDNIFNYRTLDGNNKLTQLEDGLKRREQSHWECSIAIASLEAIPAEDRDTFENDEVARLKKAAKSLEYGINRLRAMKGLL